MGITNLRVIVGCCFVLSIWMFPARAQTAFDFAQQSTPAIATGLSEQEFHCHTGYPLAQCQRDIVQLKSILTHYPVHALGHWTWVLIRSEDWNPISRRLGLNPDSPAFTALEPRETFLEEALFIHDAERTSELMKEWQRSMPELLELAVSHELGHALCADPNEAAAQRFGEELRNGRTPRCQIAKRKEARTKSVATGETHPARSNAFNVP